MGDIVANLEGMVACKCVPSGSEYDCTCACGARLRSATPNLFHVCRPASSVVDAGGVARCSPGSHLKKLLSLIGITAKPNCSCNARARTMDANGCDWCEEHLEEIVGWLREEAGKRGLPFLDAAGRVLVRRAIRNARKEQARAQAAKEGSDQGGGPAV